MKWQRRLIWLGILVLLWLFCSGIGGVAVAAPLAERLANYPDWQGQPPVQAARGDLSYPDWFAGKWIVTTTLQDMVAPLAPAILTPGFESNRQFLDQPITFKVRFVTVKPTGLRAGFARFVALASPLVSDRAYNGMQLAKAYLGEGVVQAVKVDPENPNRQITLLRGDRQLVSTVTARAAESSPNQFITSELFQQEFRSAAQIYFNQVENTTAYTRQLPTADPVADSSVDLSEISLPVIVANQVTAIYLSPQDPDYFKTLTGDSPLSGPRPVALYRYRLEFRPDASEPADNSRPKGTRRNSQSANSKPANAD
jgi:hypothetical protein